MTYSAPRERDPHYFRIWQRVSVALQRALRVWIPERYFADVLRFEDRQAAYQVLVYAACRPSYGRPKTEFTYDIADPEILESAMHNIGVSLRVALEPVESRLRAAGKAELSHRYSHVWRQDILRGVRKRPKHLIALLAAEAKLINAVIRLGTTGDWRKFSRAANAALRNILGGDLRDLGVRVLEEAVRVLAEQAAGRVAHLIDIGIGEGDDLPAAGSPHRGIGGEENRHDGHTHGGGEMRDSGIVSDVDASGREPAGQLVQVVVSEGAFERVFGSCDPADRTVESLGDSAETIQRPVFSRAS